MTQESIMSRGSAFPGRWVLGLLLVAHLIPVQAVEVALGHKDFYPSPQRPVGFRGDGNGCFPGATPVAEFWDGTPAQVDRPLMTESFGKTLDHKGKTTAKVWDVTDEKSKNLVWKTRLPGWSLADPVVVGDRVFAVGEPDWLTCVDAHSGKVLWQTRVLPLLCDGKTPEEAARLQQVIDIAAVFWILRGQHGASLFGSSPEAVTAPMAAKLAERLPAWRKTIQDADDDPKLLEAFDRGAAAIASRANADFSRNDLLPLVGAVERKYRVPVGTEWYGHVGSAMSTPVSDGERVYVVYGQGQVAAYDLDGHLMWAKRFAEWEGGKRGTCNMSPTLCDHLLIIKSPNSVKWRALDARTGELIWERKEGTHWMPARVVRLRTAQGEPVNAVLYPKSRQIRRVEDDRVLGEVPVAPKDPGPTELAGFQWLVCRDQVFFSPSYVDQPTAVIYRLRATAGDRVDAEEVHDMPKGVGGAKDYLATTPEHVLCGSGKRGSILLQPFEDPLLQAMETAIPRGGAESGAAIVAGKTVFSLLGADGGNNAWFRGPRPDSGGQGGQGRATDRKAMVLVVTADITDPAAVRTLGKRNLLQEAGPASDIYVEQYLNGMDPFLFAGCYHGSASWFGGMMGSMTPSGNRLFIQSASHLRCIGDPAVPYDWNPQSRPAHITNALKAKE
jgi:hypothetical protein